MNFQKNVKGLMILYMFGFFVGNIYANLFAKDYIASIGIFSEYFLNHYILVEINEKRYMTYLIQLRVVPLLLICGLGMTRLRKAAVIVIMVWTGFLSGIVVAAAIIKMGIAGTFFTFIIAFPHMLFYFAAYMILFKNIFQYPNYKWNYSRILTALIIICIGIVTECYVNPLLIKLFLKTV